MRTILELDGKNHRIIIDEAGIAIQAKTFRYAGWKHIFSMNRHEVENLCDAWLEIPDGVRAELAALRATVEQQAQHIAALKAASIMLIGKIKRIHDSDEYRAVWECAQSHRGKYRGESYEDELIALSELLATHPAPAQQEQEA